MAPSAAAAEPAAVPDHSGVTLHTPVNLRSASLLVIASLLSLTALHLDSAVFVPLVMGVMFSYALGPLVNRMVRLHIPRALAAAILLLGLIGAIGSIAYSLRDDTVELIEYLPAVLDQFHCVVPESTARRGAGRHHRKGSSGSQRNRTRGRRDQW